MAAGAPPEPAFVPETPASMPEPLASPARPTLSIEVKLAGAVLRVALGTDTDLLTTVLRAVRASAV